MAYTLKEDKDMAVKGVESYEEWLPVPGTEDGYEVSDRGRVRRLPVDWWGEPRIMAGAPSAAGYLRVYLRRDGYAGTWFVHELVAEVFRGPRPLGYDTHHCDYDPLNNRATNLIYVTRKRHTELHPDSRRGQALNADAVSKIREQVKAGWTTRELMGEWNVCASTISNIRTGRTFKEK